MLDERQRRMLWRMTLLRQPWEWGLMAHLGEPAEDGTLAEAAAEELCRTSLLETTELGDQPHFTLHPATAAYVRSRRQDDESLRQETHRRVGAYLEAAAKTSRWIETDLEAGHHLFEAGAYDRACALLGSASDWLRNRGRVREGLRILEPFLTQEVRQKMQPLLVGRQKAIDFHQQALAIAREGGDRRGEANACWNSGPQLRPGGGGQRKELSLRGEVTPS